MLGSIGAALIVRPWGTTLALAEIATDWLGLVSGMSGRSEFNANKVVGKEEQINAGLWGKRLAEYLVDKLKPHGIETEEIIAEDWGWYIPIKNEGFQLAICCGHQDGGDDESLCFTDPAKPIIRKLFKKIDAT